jgi:hypothetical protein
MTSSSEEAKFDRDAPTAGHWIRLSDSKEKLFYSGVLLKFKTSDWGGDFYKYALAVSVDGAAQLSFVGLDGGTWGYGRSKLPEESNYEGKSGTLGVHWLRSHLHHICTIEDKNDVWYCEDFFPVPIDPPADAY